MHSMLGRVMERICIGGCGATGAVTAALLRGEGLTQAQLSVWDKSRGAGGRMTTSRNPTNEKCTLDLGAQYISSPPADYNAHKSIYDDLESEGVLKPLCSVIEGDNRQSDGTKHFVPPQGSGSLVKYFIKKAGVTPNFGQGISSVNLEDGKWVLESGDSGVKDSFDCVILTLPVPQILQLKGTIKEIIGSNQSIQEKLKKVEYSSRFAMGLFYKEGTSINLPWAAKYFPKDDCIRFVSIDNKKRGIVSPEVGSSVVVHTSVPFGVRNLEGDKDEVCTQIVQPKLEQLVPELPAPESVKCLKWRYSQVYKGYEGSPGCVVLNEFPLLILAGDAFTHSKFDGCIDSAMSAVNEIRKRATNSSL